MSSVSGVGSVVKSTRRAIQALGFLLIGALLISQVRLTSHLFRLFDVSEEREYAALEHIAPYTCDFRGYYGGDNRFYGLLSGDYPFSFLRVSVYIFGKPPILLPIDEECNGNNVSTSKEGLVHLSPREGKVCKDFQPEELIATVQVGDDGQSWRKQLEHPVMDGTNPSMLSMERLQEEITSQQEFPWKDILRDFNTATFLVASTFKRNHQCELPTRWKQLKLVRKPLFGRDRNKEVDIMIVDERMKTLSHTYVWGNVKVANPQNCTAPNRTMHQAADDARIFVHDGAIWMTYKRFMSIEEGLGDGKVQYMTKLRFEYDPTRPNGRLRAYTTEEFSLCCGRNFGALSMPVIKQGGARNEPGNLSLLTWPDPVWVQSVNTRSPLREFQLDDPNYKSHTTQGKSSGYHGTSGHLLYLANTDEYLGVGHIHRERRWAIDKRMDARWGHHYSHSFFTISGHPPYILKRLSQEFVFPSKVENYTRDADVVQFASGLEWVPGTHQRQLAIGYGINDCEGAIVYVKWDVANSMLRPVDHGTEVAAVMTNATREAFLRDANSTYQWKVG